MARTLLLLLACMAAVLGIAAAQSYGAGTMDCSSIAGCAQCVPFAFNIREAAANFAAQQAAKAQARQARAAAKAGAASTAGAAGPAGTAGTAEPAAAAAPNTPPGRGLLAADVVESVDAADAAITSAGGAEGDMATVASCATCAAGYSLITRSVRGRPPMGRCDCAAGYGRQDVTSTKLTPNGKTRLVKSFTCAQCGPDQVPLTPQSGLRITNAGVVLLQEPIVAAAGETVPRGKYLPGPVAKRFNLVPGQCVECPAGSSRTADGITCEAA